MVSFHPLYTSRIDIGGFLRIEVYREAGEIIHRRALNARINKMIKAGYLKPYGKNRGAYQLTEIIE